MKTPLIISFLCFAICKQSLAFINGFPKEQCDEMDPTKIKLEGAKGLTDAEFNETESITEDSPPTSIQMSGSLNLYRIVTSSQNYRRGRTLNITIRGPECNAFMLQVRKIGSDERRGYDQPVRVGEFVQWPGSVKPVMCDKNEKNALTNKNYAPKSGLSFLWKAPNEDVGEVQIVARFLSGDEYWQLTESREISMNEFPVNLKSCGKAKSCILYSENKASCHEDDCDYILTYNVVNNSNVEFVLGGSAKGEPNYLAVGFSMKPEAETLKMIACIKAMTNAEMKYFTLNSIDEGLMEYPMRLENKKMDFDGDRMWCSFVVPMVTPGEDGNGLDLSVPQFQFYLRGQANNTRGSYFPILPAKYLSSKKEISVDKIKLQYHTMEKPIPQSGADTLNHAIHILISAIATIHLWANVRRSL